MQQLSQVDDQNSEEQGLPFVWLASRVGQEGSSEHFK